ncbi:MAG: hypothetical protein AAF570_12985, partial [Bacteroidota bacterium]
FWKNSDPNFNFGKEHIFQPLEIDRNITALERSQIEIDVRASMVRDYELQVDAQNAYNDFKNNGTPTIGYDLPVDFDAQVIAEVDRRIDQIEPQTPWFNLFQPVSDDDGRPIWTVLEANLDPPAADRIGISEVKSSIDFLASRPSASLERAFTEHLDTVSFRLDAWISALYHERLNALREAGAQGLQLGAFGYLEDLDPRGDYGSDVFEARRRSFSNPNNNQRSNFDFIPNPTFENKNDWVYIGNSGDDHGLEWDEKTGEVVPAAKMQADHQGFIHTPSINQAITAAILRAGYKADEDLDSALATNLNSERVRTALFYMEGVRNGQELGALLGYRLERAFHDKHADIGLPRHLHALRTAYPLVAGNGGANYGGADIEQAEANHVVDGLKLIEALRHAGSGQDWATRFDFGADEALVIEEVELLANEMDAVADLSIAEAVFQMSQGRRERADAVLQALNGEQPFPEIEFIRTPRSSHTLKHRVCLHLNAQKARQVYWFGRSSRAYAAPHLNTFLGLQMPRPADICFNAYLDQTDENGEIISTRRKIRLDEIGLQPIDFFILLGRTLENPESSELSKHIAYFARLKYFETDEGQVRISYATRDGFTNKQHTLFECLAQLEALVDVVKNARPMGHADLIRPGEMATGRGAWDLDDLEDRLDHALNGGGRPYSLKALISQLEYSIKYINQKRQIPKNATLIRQRLMSCTKLNIEFAFPVTVMATEMEELESLLEQAERVKADLLALRQEVNGMLAAAKDLAPEARKRTCLEGFKLV